MATTWNASDQTAGITLSNGSLTATIGAGGTQSVRSLDRVQTGKYYWEFTYGATITGVASGFATIANAIGSTSASSTNAIAVTTAGLIFVANSNLGSTGGTISAGSVICLAIDIDNRLVWARNGAAGNWNNNAANNPVTGVGGISIAGAGINTGIAVYALFTGTNASGSSGTANFGSVAYAGTRPTGFVDLPTGTSNTANNVTTQIAAEQWGSGTPAMWMTQAAVEMWASVQATSGTQMTVTQMAIEQWASVASVPVAAGGPMVTMIG
ncbi:MAG TPA: hypothetical protein VNM37_02980 [Candidatus Dormibacteraeota bacterium]|nr:hypothetical protein [Candidatus Dormibacteraeota bacterium]